MMYASCVVLDGKVGAVTHDHAPSARLGVVELGKDIGRALFEAAATPVLDRADTLNLALGQTPPRHRLAA
jgi:hypothetical protein